MPETDPDPALDVLRLRAVEALTPLAASPRWTDRRDAGAALAGFLDAEPAQAVLHDLVLDDESVARATAAALARQPDPRGWVVLTLALATADDEQHKAVEAGVTEVVSASAATRLVGARTGLRLQEHPDPDIAAGATRLLALLGAPGDEVGPHGAVGPHGPARVTRPSA